MFKGINTGGILIAKKVGLAESKAWFEHPQRNDKCIRWERCNILDLE